MSNNHTKRTVKAPGLAEWYTAPEAAAKLSQNAGRSVNKELPRYLADRGKVRTFPITSRMILYYKPDIDTYTPSARRGRQGKARSGGAVCEKCGEAIGA